MTDPFEVLRSADFRADPDSAFAARLRARVERALALPRGVAVTAAETAVKTQPTAAGAAIPYLAVPAGEGRRAIDWYVEVYAARQVGEPIMMPDGKLGHAELEISGGMLYLAEEFPDLGFVAPRPGISSVSLGLTVPDVEETVAVAVRRGGELTSPPRDAYGHRGATVVDPFGHRWLLQTPLAEGPAADAPPAYRHGDIGYLSLWVPDVRRAEEFYAAVLGWTYTPGSGPQGRQILGTAPPQGLWGGQERSTGSCSFVVDDVPAAVRRVRAAGGEATDPREEPYGTAADCIDDQGMPFSLHQTAGEPGRRPPANGARQGDVAYLTFEVPDTERAQAFYGAVLGWTFTGRGDPEGVVPMTGISGGHAEATVVPMWKVDDVAAAVERVRAAGGRATDPERKPYGTTAECTDDQGSRFYLGDA